MNFNIRFKPWEERGVQIRQEEISVREVGIAGRWQLEKQHTIPKVQISLYRVHSLTLSDDHSIKIGVIFNAPCAFEDNTSISEAPHVSGWYLTVLDRTVIATKSNRLKLELASQLAYYVKKISLT